MQRLNFSLKKYVKAIRILCLRHGFERLEVIPNKGSVVRFELFVPDEEIPQSMWTVHHKHNKRKAIYSREDYKKVIRHIKTATLDEFMEILIEL
jgi:hypothetical protein